MRVLFDLSEKNGMAVNLREGEIIRCQTMPPPKGQSSSGPRVLGVGPHSMIQSEHILIQ